MSMLQLAFFKLLTRMHYILCLIFLLFSVICRYITIQLGDIPKDVQCPICLGTLSCFYVNQTIIPNLKYDLEGGF